MPFITKNMPIFATKMEQNFTKTSKCSLGYKTRSNTDYDLHAIDHGAVMLCLAGTASLYINFDRFYVSKDYVIAFFPGEAVTWVEMSRDFQGIILRYDSDILREASMQVEHAVYNFMRTDRLFRKELLVEHVIKSMFKKLMWYFGQPDCRCIDAIVTMELKSYFLGLYDYLQHHPEDHHSSTLTPRVEELFGKFMMLLERDYKQSHDVQYYADQLFITRKYLNMISNKRTGLSPKRVIDDYIVLQLKLTLRGTKKSIKEIAADFHFDDESFLVRYFKQHADITPLKYRQNASLR